MWVFNLKKIQKTLKIATKFSPNFRNFHVDWTKNWKIQKIQLCQRYQRYDSIFKVFLIHKYFFIQLSWHVEINIWKWFQTFQIIITSYLVILRASEDFTECENNHIFWSPYIFSKKILNFFVFFSALCIFTFFSFLLIDNLWSSPFYAIFRRHYFYTAFPQKYAKKVVQEVK